MLCASMEPGGVEPHAEATRLQRADAPCVYAVSVVRWAQNGEGPGDLWSAQPLIQLRALLRCYVGLGSGGYAFS